MIKFGCYKDIYEWEARGFEPIGISRTQPRNIAIMSYKPLVPESWNVVNEAKRGNWEPFKAQLAKLDPQAAVKELNQYGDVVLLCWEYDESKCHRGLVRKWIEAVLK